MTYYGWPIYDEREVDGGWQVSYRGWTYQFDTLRDAKGFIKTEEDK